MICNYFRVVHIIIEKIIIGNTQRGLEDDVPETSSEDFLKFLTSRTCRGPSGDSQRTNTKVDNFMKKLIFRSNSPCIKYLFLFSYRKNKYLKVLNGDVHGASTGPSCETTLGTNDGGTY